ncbi:hypothetical protein T492DRAFT_891890, partial [Pavlovales sp. CCMP2436]
MALTLLLFAGGQDRRLDPHLAPHRAFINIEAKSESIERSLSLERVFYQREALARPEAPPSSRSMSYLEVTLVLQALAYVQKMCAAVTSNKRTAKKLGD